MVKDRKRYVFVLVLMIAILVSPLTGYANRRDDLIGAWIVYSPVGNGWGDSGILWDFWPEGTWVRINENNQGTRIYGTWEFDGANILTLRAGNFGWENDTRFHTISWDNLNRIYVTLRGSVNPELVLTSQWRPIADLTHEPAPIPDPIPTHTHTPGNWITTREATCTETGHRERSCTVCNDVIDTEIIPPLPHIPSGEWITDEEPLCNTPGRRVQLCTVSGTIAVYEPIPPLTGLDHVFDQTHIRGNIFIPPIVSQYVCEICGYDTGVLENFAMAWVSPSILGVLVTIAILIFAGRRSIKKAKKFVCPYCFEGHSVHAAQFRCANLNCGDVDDLELTRYENNKSGLPLQRKRTFPAPASKGYDIPKFAKCPDCSRETSKVVCPSCHNSLPNSSLTGEDMIISVVGSRDVGKSHYIGVIINELIERVAGRFGGSLTGFDDTMTRYEERFGRNLYTDLQKIELTQSSTTSSNRPLIFSFKIGKGKKIKQFTLVFFDTAGEDLNAFDTMNTVNRYICKSAGVIFLLDPMQIWEVRNQLPDDLVSRASSVAVQQATKPDDIMTRVSELIRNDKKMSATKKIDMPVAAVFSKFDAIVPIVPPGSTILTPSPHCDAGAFVMADWHNVNTEIQSLLSTWGATAFVTQLNLNYSNYSYFTASALGLDNSPQRDGSINRPTPHRIEDALIWILKENGVIDAKK